MKLLGKVALVTGSSRGIGKAIAAALAKEGAHVVINASSSRSEAKKAYMGLPRPAGQKHSLIIADIAAPGQISKMMCLIGKKYGCLDILVNNAGTTTFIKHSELDKLTQDIFDKIYAVNLRGAFLCVQKALPLLKRSDSAQVINIASIAAMTGVGSNIAYCAMKAGLVNMTLSLARALAPGIRVNAISPGLTETGLMKGWGKYPAEQIRRTPLGRLGRPEDTAAAVLALIDPLKYVTGHNLVIDGGRTLE